VLAAAWSEATAARSGLRPQARSLRVELCGKLQGSGRCSQPLLARAGPRGGRAPHLCGDSDLLRAGQLANRRTQGSPDSNFLMLQRASRSCRPHSTEFSRDTAASQWPSSEGRSRPVPALGDQSTSPNPSKVSRVLAGLLAIGSSGTKKGQERSVEQGSKRSGRTLIDRSSSADFPHPGDALAFSAPPATRISVSARAKVAPYSKKRRSDREHAVGCRQLQTALGDGLIVPPSRQT